MEELVRSQKWSWVTFETGSRKHFVEVAFDPPQVVAINVAYPHSEDYRVLFSRKEIELPAGWRVKEFKQKRWYAAGLMLLLTTPAEIDRIPEFVDLLFRALYGERADYQLKGVFQ